jgi:acetylornithine/succinyldiaminopimelate/putrescine aminotransferase
MPFDLGKLLETQAGRNFELHKAHLNHQMVRVLQMTGFDKFYEHGRGAHVFDADGNDYLDFLSGFGVFGLGRNHPVLQAALHEAIDLDAAHLVQLDCSLLSGLLGEQLCERAGKGLDRCFFTNSGTEAVETAIKFARRHTGRPRIVYCEHAFHGLTTGSLSLNGGKEFRDGFGPLSPATTPIPYNDLRALEAELQRGDVAAFVFEAIQGKSVEVSSVEHLQEIRRLCDRYSALMVVDEVQTGLGRTGELFCYQHADVIPDIVTIAKALSGGFVPVGAALTRDKVWRSVYRSVEDAMVHSSTFGQNTLAMVAGLATLDVIDSEDLVAQARVSGEKLTEGLRALQAEHEVITDVRGRGLMIGIEFGRPPTAGQRTAFRALQAVRKGLFAQLIVEPLFNEHRIITQVAADEVNIVKLLPPLMITDSDIDRFLTAFDAVVSRASHLGASTARLGRDFAVRAVRTGALRK